MSRRKSFQKGERVILSGKTVTIERVEKQNTKIEGIKSDMGRYTIRYEDGSTLRNAPGYLMARPGEIRRR